MDLPLDVIIIVIDFSGDDCKKNSILIYDRECVLRPRPWA